MKSTIMIALAVSAQAHTIFQQAHHHNHLPFTTQLTHPPSPTPRNSPSTTSSTPPLVGLRAPHLNYPIHDVSDARMACGPVSTHSNRTIDARAGDRVGAWWGAVIGGEAFPGDPDHPIPPGHKGPISTYMAKVEDAVGVSLEEGEEGLRWFKIQESGLDVETGRWAVDEMIAERGWVYVDLPKCLAPGEYLLRQEVLALHSAAEWMGAQFYQSCAQLNVTGGGGYVPEETVAIPGVYGQDDPGVLVQIYVDGVPDHGRKPYPVPGPRPMTCPA
ncbi:glycosyl hydrolase family 61-domain-containing protein [Chaetomium fimeti]|uniref:lytic cellulose monooxygenase (C4-dehydrogenating) n=1 Tax=Chaetomium fimeti TaxID=1854472 RepID=A0AAE0H9W2_9PEZI|nr:glycosyl hydrolase family 61-domain-containing protein [Chaetomium fimeti]